MSRHGRDAFYGDFELRQRCSRSARCSRSSARLPASAPGSRGSAAHSPFRAGRTGSRRGARPREVQPAGGVDRARRCGHYAAIRPADNALYDQGYRSIGCAPYTRRSCRTRTSAPGAGGGSPRTRRSAACMGASRKGPPPPPEASMLARAPPISTGSSRGDLHPARGRGPVPNPVLFFSGGKDSIRRLRLAEKAFRPGGGFRSRCCTSTPGTTSRGDRVPRPARRRARRAAHRALGRGLDPPRHGEAARGAESRNAAQSVTLLEAIDEFGFDALIGGRAATRRRRGEGARLLLPRRVRAVGPAQPAARALDASTTRGSSRRAPARLPDLQLDRARRLAVHRARAARGAFDLLRAPRDVVRRRGLLVPVTRLTPPRGRDDRDPSVRFRTVGDISCTCPVESTRHRRAIIDETPSRITERGATRMDDQTSEASMERRKREGYF